MRGFQRLTILAAVLVLTGCGGSGGGGGVKVDTDAAPLDFSFAPPPAPLSFKVEMSSETEARGTSFISSIRFNWEAADWVREGDAWTCDVTFKGISAAMRRGSGIGMETLDAFDRLEGFSTRYRKGAEGFAPVVDPVKDNEFMSLFGQLQQGLVALDIVPPDSPVRPGASWTEALDEENMAMLKPVMRDSVMTLTYVGDELFRGRDCAFIKFAAKVPLDGIIDVEEGPQAGTRAKFDGKIEISGKAYYDKARGFLLQNEGKSKAIINQREVDERGKPTGAEQSFVQNGTFTVRYQGE